MGACATAMARIGSDRKARLESKDVSSAVTNSCAQLRQRFKLRAGDDEQHTAMVVVEIGPTQNAGVVRVTARTVVTSSIKPEACTLRSKLQLRASSPLVLCLQRRLEPEWSMLPLDTAALKGSRIFSSRS